MRTITALGKLNHVKCTQQYNGIGRLSNGKVCTSVNAGMACIVNKAAWSDVLIVLTFNASVQSKY